ncbi:MAG: ATP-dependent Clp protease proteolytic subunit, partial [Deltaproteobacteria bacterium]|nr:ATP-dependent Clp protease proteolytic subunit [Deltaproteobacteria bacterium]
MPSRNEIQKEILDKRIGAQDEIRRRYLRALANYTHRDTIVYASAFTAHKGPIVPGLVMSVTLEDIQGFMAALHGLKGDKLDLIIHSPGGSMEAADQIVQYLRSKYKHIRAIIPQNAMSAATMIACACDEIIMGKHSAIGPIDPQITFPTSAGSFTAPAQSILDEFEQAKKEVKENPSTAPLWVNKIKAYPHGFLNICLTTLKLSQEKVEEWLNTYMFSDLPEDIKSGSKIAEWLVNAKIHKTHGRPITIEKAREVGLYVTALEDDQKLQEKVLSAFHAIMVTFG